MYVQYTTFLRTRQVLELDESGVLREAAEYYRIIRSSFYSALQKFIVGRIPADGKTGDGLNHIQTGQNFQELFQGSVSESVFLADGWTIQDLDKFFDNLRREDQIEADGEIK